jgi:hypothetical protein
MPDTPLDMLVVRDMPDGMFAVADALQGIRVVQEGLKSRSEAEKFIEDYYLARGRAPALRTWWEMSARSSWVRMWWVHDRQRLPRGWRRNRRLLVRRCPQH